MTKLTCGEVAVNDGRKDITLRLPIIIAQDLEYYYGISIMEVAFEKLKGVKTLIGDTVILYAAMTGRDISDEDDCAKAGEEVMSTVGIWQANNAIYQCMMANLAPDLGDDERGKRKAAIKAKAEKAAKKMSKIRK